MPPRKPAVRPPPGSAQPSSRTDLVKRGSRQIQVKHPTRLDKNGLLPSTARALVLRNGKQGAMGTGELMSLRKPIGREKLDLLGEDFLAQLTKNALTTPFNIERLLNTADAAYSAHIDSIKWLQDPELFYDELSKEIHSNLYQSPESTHQNPTRDRNTVLNVLGTRIHNSYMLASAWKIVRDRLELLEQKGIDNSNVRSQLANNPNLRQEYLAVCDVLHALIAALQARFSLLAATAGPFRMYFKKYEESDPNNPEYMFDWTALRDSYKSYVGSIVIELCLPNSKYPKYILARMLEDATYEAPREAKRFPQALFDALGDFSVALQVQETLDTLLIGPQAEKWRNQSRSVPEELRLWIEAQSLSEDASKTLGRNLDDIFPLEKTKESRVVDAMWTRINDTYKAAAKMDLGTLWQVEDAFLRVPQWSTTVSPRKHTKAGGGPKRSSAVLEALRITDGNDTDSASMLSRSDSMPSLEISSGSDYFTDSDGEEESEFDPEEETDLSKLERKAMDIASARPEIFEEKEFEELSNDNHFLKALGALRGRLFSSNPRLRTNRPGTQVTPTFPNLYTDGQGRGGCMVTIEEVEDEDAPRTVAKKKKKKKPKKKKKSVSSVDIVNGPEAGSPPPSSPIIEPPSPIIPSPPLVVEVPPSPPPTSQAKKKKSEKRQPAMRQPNLTSSSTTSFASILTASLEQTRAQSAHSYLQSENLAEQKVKVKTRAELTSRPPVQEEDTKRGFFSRFSRKREAAPHAPEEEEKKEKKEKRNLGAWFKNMNRRNGDFLAQILGTDKSAKKGGPPMKWDHFVKVMIDMGFEVDASTAGSSVRFQPPDPALRSISFHKPHPENTIDPITLQKWGKKLKSYYGWSEEILLEHANLQV